MEKILVTEENCEKVGRDLLLKLIGYRLKIISFYTNPGHNLELPTVLPDLKVTANLTYKVGLLKIELTPRRTISWDISKEKVMVVYLDDGDVIVQRILADGETIQRVINCEYIIPPL